VRGFDLQSSRSVAPNLPLQMIVTVRASVTAAAGTGGVLALELLIRVAQVVILLAVWGSIPDTSIAGMTRAQLLTYTIVAGMSIELLNVRTPLGTWIWDGSISSALTKPMRFDALLIGHAAGRWVVLTVPSVPLMLTIAWISGVSASPSNMSSAVLSMLSFPLAIILGLCMDGCLNLLVVLLALPLWIVEGLRGALVGLLSGALIPLAAMPPGLGRLFQYLPFASVASTPLTLYIGTNPNPFLGILVQVAWCIAIGALTLKLWRLSRERMVSYGG